MEYELDRQPVNTDIRTADQNENLEPVRGAAGKIVYNMRGLHLVDAKKIWPNHDGLPEGAQVAMGEHYTHGDWYPIRTSLIVNVDREQGLVETMNSVYRSIDGVIG